MFIDPARWTIDPEKVRYNVIGVEMKVEESSLKLVALGATQRKGNRQVWKRNGSVRQNREAGARIHVSEGMDRDVTVMKYEEYG